MKSAMERGSDIAKMDTISLSVSCIVKQSDGKTAMNVLQLDVSIRASTTTRYAATRCAGSASATRKGTNGL
ncbi:hypothetical protein LSCM4_05994 [Leishmania orientalis]|uniref:Uncharacterized protein n=1 Tax=Leishmania orientalis TaxID=2249476 RepID=A0A836HPV9_9TRYP|nr:hypothetical protein LSCM4_05994 [Leishmania orientalis]